MYFSAIIFIYTELNLDPTSPNCVMQSKPGFLAHQAFQRIKYLSPGERQHADLFDGNSAATALLALLFISSAVFPARQSDVIGQLLLIGFVNMAFRQLM